MLRAVRICENSAMEIDAIDLDGSISDADADPQEEEERRIRIRDHVEISLIQQQIALMQANIDQIAVDHKAAATRSVQKKASGT